VITALAMHTPAFAVAPVYQQTDLISDVPGLAANTDPHLIAAWGLTRFPTSAWWVTSPLAGVSVVYTGAGLPTPAANPLVVALPAPEGMTIPSIPTGVVSNTTAGFTLIPDRPARFIFVTRTGTISGWNPQVNPTNAMIRFSRPGVADYTGVTLAKHNGADLLYVANFGENRVDIFNTDFIPVQLPGEAFNDGSLDEHNRVFNVQLVGGELYVTYAPRDIFDPTGGGAGRGKVNVFDTSGRWLRRLKQGPWMNAPWGVVLAPEAFGHFGGNVLVGMFGDGAIVAFDAAKGNYQGTLRGTSEDPLTIARGLWGLGFGNDGAAGPSTTLYFATDVAIGDTLHGLFGKIVPADSAN
jgi:uncharacterized protein (TIGR03118 family)